MSDDTLPPPSGPGPGPAPVRVPRRGGLAWRYFGDVRCLLVSPELLLLQVAHPVVGAGVEQYSDFRAAPWPRLWRTLVALSTVVYGGQRAATAEAERLIAIHKPMKGTDSQGRRYHALHPEAYHWVHATLVRGAVDAHRVFGTGLSGRRLEEYYQEMRGVGRIWGLNDCHLPADWPSFVAYYDEMIDQRLELNRSVQDVLDALRHPTKPRVWWLPSVLWWPFAALAGRCALLVTIGLLPPVLRERFGLPWSPRQERALRRFARLVRLLMALVPPPLRIATALWLAGRSRHRSGAAHTITGPRATPDPP